MKRRVQLSLAFGALLGWMVIPDDLSAASVSTSAVEPHESAGALSVAVKKSERRLIIEAPSVRDVAQEVRILTEGLTRFERGVDVNEPGIVYLPPPADAHRNPEAAEIAENYFFFNDLITAPEWELVIEFDPAADGTWKLNGRFSPLGGALAPRIVIPFREVEQGENLLHVRSHQLRPPVMYWRRAFALSAPVEADVQVNRSNWSGRVILVKRNDSPVAIIAERTISTEAVAPANAVTPLEVALNDRAELTRAVLAVGKNILRARVVRQGSLFENGFNLVYDPTRQSHRMPHWIWSWGPSIDLLFRLSHFDAVRKAGLAEPFRTAAVKAAQRSLNFEVTNPDHPARGISTVRWEPSRATPSGWAEYMSTADSLFLAGWGWMSAYAETNDPVFLARTQSLVAAATRLMGEYPVIPQDWIVERARWTPHTLDESVFGTVGFRRLYEASHSAEVAKEGRRFLESHLTHMGRESGLLARAWMRDEDKEIWDPDIKGHAWVIEGYLDAYRLSGDAHYLELCRQLAERVMSCQADDGSWTYLFKRPAATDQIDDKGTAIWAYLFYDLYKVSRNPAHLAAGRRALHWCLRHQDRSDDANVAGAILHENSMAYVKRRPMTILYTTTFFGLALLEELALNDKDRADRQTPSQ